MCNLFIVTTTVVESFDLKCNVLRADWGFTGEIEYCDAVNVDIRSKNEKITSVNGRTEPTVRGLGFQSKLFIICQRESTSFSQT